MQGYNVLQRLEEHIILTLIANKVCRMDIPQLNITPQIQTPYPGRSRKSLLCVFHRYLFKLGHLCAVPLKMCLMFT